MQSADSRSTGEHRGRGEKTTAKSPAQEMSPQNSSQATENLDGDHVVESPIWPAQRQGLDSSSNFCSVVDLS